MPERTEIRSEEVQDILGHIPHWVIRWGISIIFFTIVILLLGSYFFKYPDIISSPIVVTTENPPAQILARSDGKIDQIWVSNGRNVNEDQSLALIQSPMKYKDYLKWKSLSDSINIFLGSFETFLTIRLPDDLELGMAQEAYIKFVNAFNEYQHFVNLTFYKQKVTALKSQIEKYNDYEERLRDQMHVLDKELQLTQNQYDREKGLYDKEVISRKELEKSESELLGKKFESEKSKTALASTKMELDEIKKEILDLELEYENRKKSIQLELKEAYNELKAVMHTWEHNYLLKSPINGRVTFTKFWSVNQNVIAGERVFTIVPQDSARLIGRIKLQIRGSGKVAAGQTVNIKFDNYPFMEYGLVQGRVDHISLVPEDNKLIVDVSFPEGLLTNYGKRLQFTQEMIGKAEIITEEIRLIEKLLNPIRLISKKQKSLSR